MMASDLSSGCTDVIDILDDEKEEGEISLEDVSSSEEGGMGHLTSSYVVGRTRACPDCKSWGECATWCNATYHPKSRRDPVKGKENRRHVRETGAATKHLSSTLQEKNDDDDLVPISSDSDMEIVGLTDTSNRSKAKVKKKKRKKKNYESLTLDELLSPSSIDLSIADVRVGSLKVYREISPGRIPSGRSKVIPRSPVRRYRSPAVAARSSFRSSRSPVSNSRSPIQKRTLRKVRSPKRSPRRPVHSPVRAAKRPPSKLSSPSFARSHVPSDRHGDVTRLLKRVKRLDSMGTHASEPSVNRSKESSSLKEKLSNMLKRSGSDDHALHLKGKSKVQSKTMNDADDEEDLALLRQKALETKPKKSNRPTDHLTDAESEKISTVNDDQDEEALQLRMIALRSAVMKKHQNRVERGIKAKRSTRSESPFSSSFLDDIPVPSDELYVSPLCSPSYDSNNVEDMDLDTDVEREKEKLPYSPTDKITEHISIDTALLGIEPSDVSFINVNETIGSPVFDNAQDELETNTVTLYYDKSYLSYQVLPATEYIPYSPSQSCSEIYHADLNDAAGKGPENHHGHDVVCDLIDGICCQEGTYSSTGVASDTTHALPVSKSLLAPPVSPHDTLPSSPQMQQIVEQSTNDDVEFVNVDSTFRNEKSACDAQTTPGYSVTDAPVTTAYAESMSLNEPMITIDDLPENDADLLSCPSVALGDDRNLPATEHIPKEAAPCRATAEEPLYMQGVPDITKDTNKIPTLINRTLVPAPILKSNRQLRQRLKKRETPNPEPAFKSAEMQPVTVTTTDTSTSVFKPIKLQAAKKSAPVLSASATFDDSMNESLDMAENQGDSPGKDHEAGEPEHPEAADTPSASSEAAPTRSDKRKHARKNCRKSLDMPLLESEESSCSDASVNKDTDIVNASALDRQTAVESDQSKSNDNADAQESSIGNGESLRLQSVTDTQEPANSRLLTERRDVEKNNHIMALSDRLRVVEHSQEEHIKSHCLSTNPAPDNSDSNVPDKAVNTTKSDSNRRQSIDEDENELRAILLASLKRTKTTDISPSVTPVISVTSSAATNVQTSALKTLAGTMPSVANATCTASSNAPSLPSRPLTSLETVKKKINNVSVTVQNGSRKRSSSLDAAKSPPKKMTRKTLTSTKVVNNAKKYQNMIVQRRLNLRKLDNSATITKPNENVWPNAGASKISSHAPDTQRFVISLGSDTDSESEGERNEPVSVPVADKHQVHQEIPADFEKNLNKFLRDMRTEQEQSAAAAKSTSSSTQATKQDVPQTDKGPSNMHTPLAVRHLPVSQQEEYRRLKQQILEREKLKLQRKVASNNGSSNSSSNSNKLSNANVTSSPVKSLPLYEKKAHIKQNQDKLKTPEKNSQELPVEVRRKSDDLARGTSESNVSRMSADKKLSANIAKHTNLTNLQTKSNKKVIPNNLSIRISNVTTLSSTEGTRTVEDREKQSMKDKQQHRPTLRALSKEEINRKCVQVQLKPDTIERVVIISDKSALQHDTTASVDQNKNPAEPDVSTEIINKKNLSNVNDNNTSAFSNASTVKLLNSSAISNVSRHEDTMETTMTFSQYETERQREISRDASTSVLAKNNDSSNASRKSDTIANDNGKANDIWDELKKDVRAELDSLTSLSELEQERYLRETEHKLVAKRYMVLDHLAEMSGNLRQWDMEEDLQTTLANEVRKLKEQLKIAEEKLQQQRDRVSSMSPKVSTARQKINAGRRECFKLSSICSTLGNRVIGRDYKLPEAVAQLLSDKIKEVANHTSQISKKKRLQPNDISENSYSSLLQETSELSKDTCTEENLSLQEQPTNNATVIDEAGSKSGISRSTQSNEDKSLSISETSNFSQTVLCQSTPEKRGKTSVNPSEHCNEEQIIFLNQNSALSEPKLYQSNPTEQNKHTEGSRTDESAPAASSELKSTAADFSNQEYNEQNNTRASPQLPSPSPSPYSPSSPSSPPSPSSSPSSSSAPSPSPSPSSAPSPSSSPSSVPLPSPSSAPSPSPSPSRSPSPITMTTTDTTTINTVTTTSTATTTTTTTTRTAKMIAPYESILMHLKKPRNINPNGILCPYELMGICRDEDCQYIHQSRNQT